MNTIELLNYLEGFNVKLSVNGTKLKCNAPEGVLTPSLKSEILEHKADLIAILQKGHDEVQPNSVIQAVDRERNSLYPSFSQQRLWFLQQLEPEISKAYHINRTLRLKGQLNIKALQEAISKILERHEALRTNLVATDGIPWQIIAPFAEFDLPFVDLSSDESGQAEEILRKLIEEELHRPFDLAKDLMLRVMLVRLKENEHVLNIILHHISSDRWSMSIFLQELSKFYQAFLSGQPDPLPKLSIQYADFASWQRQWLSGEVLESQINYWKQHLSGAPPLLELPTDYSRPPKPSYRGERLSFTISKSLTNALKSLSQKSGSSLFMTLLASFNTLLYRYTQQDDVVVGSPIANRTNSKLESLIGFFANTLALRIDLSGNPSFRELLLRVRKVALDAYAHQELPFEKLVEELQPERNLSHSPLFQVMFGLQNTPDYLYKFKDLTIQEEHVEFQAAQVDLTLLMVESDEGLIGRFEFSTDLFETATIERMVGHLKTLLVAIVANPDESINNLSLLTKAEHQLMTAWNNTLTDYPQDKCIHQLIEEQVERTPDAVAVVFEDQSITYRELNHRANQVAHHLSSLGVGAEVLVGICVERSLEMIVSLLGILKAGGSYVPLDPAYPQERLQYMVKDSQLPVLITQEVLREKFSAHNIQMVCIDTDWNAIAEQKKVNLNSGVVATNLAYTIYTSGSTGKPKGVQICHDAAVNFLRSMHRNPGLTADDCFLAVTTISFDIAVLELYLPLLVGARIVLATREVAADATQLSSLLVQSNTTVMQATPATWQMLIAAGWQGKQDLRILCGGEAMTRNLANQLLERSASLWNMYGPTETTVWSSVSQVDGKENPICLGLPIANTQFYILDEQQQLVPIGVPGELHIGGLGLARGYINQFELTEKKFISNTFSNELGDRLYRTGDLASYLPNGKIELIGRIDNQVKIRGFRIELGEIESTLAQHPDVAEVVVMVREDVPGEKRLVAYLLSNNQENTTSSKLRSFLKAKLPNYMIPSVFVTLEAIPLTPNGKVDRRALPSPDSNATELDSIFVEPRNQTERQISNIWSQVLNREKIGIYDNFFELGGHSLLATRVVNRINQDLSLELSIIDLFENPTVSSLAEALTQFQLKNAKDEDIDHILAELEELSDEEVQQLLAQEIL